MWAAAISALTDDQFGLPPVRHIPGTGSVASINFLQVISAKCPARTVSGEWQSNTPYRCGWHLFENGYFWESHEIWEQVWTRCAPNSREKVLLQAIIQLANSRLKMLQSNTQSALKIYDLFIELTQEAFLGASQSDDDHLMGLKQRDLLELNQDYAL
jgi:hypothetical protein